MIRSNAGAKSAGFTLIELMIVVFIIAVASAVAVFSLRPSDNEQSVQNAQQLAALLDAARAEARAEKNALIWSCDQSGFTVQGLTVGSSQTKHFAWQSGTFYCDPVQGVIGPEPITKAQVINVYSTEANGGSNSDPSTSTTPSVGKVKNFVQIKTDGLGPFKLAAQ